MGRLTAAAAVALWLWTAAVAAEYVKYKDPQQPVEVRVRDLMSRMTLAEKIGQMTQIEREVSSADVINKYLIGSIVSGGGSVPRPQATAEDWIDMVNAFQKGALSTRLGIPLIYGIDAIHGNNNAYKATIFPHNVGLGVTRDPELVKRIGAATALEARATGIPYTFAPCIAVCRDPRWGRCYESYSEDHEIVQMMTEIIPGLQGEVPPNYPNNFPFVLPRGKVAGCSKHFVGDGGTAYGINENDTVIEWNELQDIHMPAYLDSIRKGVATIMISYSSLNGIRMHANYDLITGYLKNTLKFEGFVISDMRGIDRLTDPPHSNYTYSVQVSILAGLDMIMVPDAYKEFIDDLTFLVNANVIPMSRINDAVRRILRVKFIMGLFENPLADLSFAHYLGSQEHRELAREAVRKSLVLLKNGKDGDGQLVPLPTRSERILVAGSHADDIGNQCGGWTIDWEGHSGNITVGTTILTAVRNSVDPDTKVVYNENPEAEYVRANNFSYAIVVVGEPPYVESSGDSTTLTLDESAYATITNVCGAVRCVVVLVTGRPVVIEPYIGEIDALVAAWLPGTEGQGVADVLFGEYGFTGRLARTWFRTVDQLPMNVGDAIYDPLFPFGYGLMTSPRVVRASQ
ncbi:beta-glucosidase BoGH3B-like [Salvia splendens]|uniref:beta-glucosidase BoGH3B-like n=1 Tax=Salvia splendens TaxID=180675 RepID=UPI001C252BD8|nr:beta-glucosidase BoGH3B-like [Salvia splendens]